MQPASGLPADEEPNFSGETQNSKQRKTTTIERARLGNQRGKSTIATGAQNSVHQYRAKILNVKHAHHHQDESNTDIGVARRIIRQAQVANFQNYYCKELTEMDPKETPDDTIQDQYRKAEHYFTNPPMAPIMCAAPPRMGKSALSLLMVSFASKMGAQVQYGVSPNKVIPKQDVEGKLASLKWMESYGMPDVNVYSQDQAKDITTMNSQIHYVADKEDEWTFHVRDEAQTLIKGKEAAIGRELEASFPIFYGLTMCVSATLLPVFMAGQMVGSIDSVRNLLKVEVAGAAGAARAAPKYIVRRGAIEKTVLMQDWSFPIAPDFLAPPRGAFPVSPDAGTDPASDPNRWYKEYYENGIVRTTNYHGTSFYVTQWRGEGGPDIVASKVLVDHSLVESRSKLNKAIRQLRQKAVKAKADDDTLTRLNQLSLSAAYNKYLANFNKLNTRYFDVDDNEWAEGAPTRIVNEPITEVSTDAARMLEQAREWLKAKKNHAKRLSPRIGKVHYFTRCSSWRPCPRRTKRMAGRSGPYCCASWRGCVSTMTGIRNPRLGHQASPSLKACPSKNLRRNTAWPYWCIATMLQSRRPSKGTCARPRTLPRAQMTTLSCPSSSTPRYPKTGSQIRYSNG